MHSNRLPETEVNEILTSLTREEKDLLAFTEIFDSDVWAKEFMVHNPTVAVDVVILREWFAMALMCGFNRGSKKGLK